MPKNRPGRLEILLVCLVMPSFLWATPPAVDEIAAIEKAIKANPEQAIRIARDATARWPDRGDLRRRLLGLAVRLQDQRVAALTEADVEDISSIWLKQLGDREAAGRLQRDWLRLKSESFRPRDAKERLHLARLSLRWLGDRDLAAGYCLDALKGNTSPEVIEYLEKDLGYRKVDNAWKPGVKPDLRIGMTAVEVEKLAGRPKRVTREILYQKHMEQWIYDSGDLGWVELEYVKGKDPRVVAIHGAK